jgi:hypothetical protein
MFVLCKTIKTTQKSSHVTSHNQTSNYYVLKTLRVILTECMLFM